MPIKDGYSTSLDLINLFKKNSSIAAAIVACTGNVDNEKVN